LNQVVLEVAEIIHDLRNSHGAGIVDYRELSANLSHAGIRSTMAEDARERKMKRLESLTTVGHGGGDKGNGIGRLRRSR
jgi:hypothetical protein